MVLDVNSGSVHVVDDCVYDVLSCMNEGKNAEEAAEALSSKYAEQDITEAREEIQELTDNGMLFTKDIYENAIDQFSNRPTVVKALCLHIAHDCNLACRYCFAEEGERRACQIKINAKRFWREATEEKKFPACMRSVCLTSTICARSTTVWVTIRETNISVPLPFSFEKQSRRSISSEETAEMSFLPFCAD